MELIDREQADAESHNKGRSGLPYVEASFKHDLMQRPVQETKPSELADVLQRLLQIEGPIHEREIERRVVDLWKLSRTGSRINDAIMKSLHWLTRQGTAIEEDDFYWLASQTDFPVRDRSEVESSLRKPDMIPPRELQTGLEDFVRDHVAVSREEAARGVARMMGFRSTSPQFREVVEAIIDKLVTSNRLTERDGQLHPV